MPDQVGRRPSNPSFLALIGVVWIACGIIALVKLSAGWKIIPGIVFIGFGVFFLRGALVAMARHDRS